MTSILWALFGSVSILAMEALFRRGWSWEQNWWIVIPWALLINYCVYKTVVTGPTYLTAIIFFTLFNAVGRIVLSQTILGEPLSKGTLVAAAMLMAGALVGRMWR